MSPLPGALSTLNTGPVEENTDATNHNGKEPEHENSSRLCKPHVRHSCQRMVLMALAPPVLRHYFWRGLRWICNPCHRWILASDHESQFDRVHLFAPAAKLWETLCADYRDMDLLLPWHLPPFFKSFRSQRELSISIINFHIFISRK